MRGLLIAQACTTCLLVLSSDTGDQWNLSQLFKVTPAVERPITHLWASSKLFEAFRCGSPTLDDHVLWPERFSDSMDTKWPSKRGRSLFGLSLTHNLFLSCYLHPEGFEGKMQFKVLKLQCPRSKLLFCLHQMILRCLRMVSAAAAQTGLRHWAYLCLKVAQEIEPTKGRNGYWHWDEIMVGCFKKRISEGWFEPFFGQDVWLQALCGPSVRCPSMRSWRLVQWFLSCFNTWRPCCDTNVRSFFPQRLAAPQLTPMRLGLLAWHVVMKLFIFAFLADKAFDDETSTFTCQTAESQKDQSIPNRAGYNITLCPEDPDFQRMGAATNQAQPWRFAEHESSWLICQACRGSGPGDSDEKYYELHNGVTLSG